MLLNNVKFRDEWKWQKIVWVNLVKLLNFLSKLGLLEIEKLYILAKLD
jgi:hypothetical protein